MRPLRTTSPTAPAPPGLPSRRPAGRSTGLLLGLTILLLAPGTALAVEPTPTPAATPAATPTPSPSPTAHPTASPSPSPAPSPTATPTVAPSASPSPTPTASPSPTPTATPAPPSPTPTGPTVLGATVTFYGRGYGHGVGLSQYGARGRAQAGQTAPEILAHYFKDTTLGAIPTTTPIRVRVLADFKATSSVPLVLYARYTTWTIDGLTTAFPKDARVTVTPTSRTVDGTTTVTWRLKIVSPTGTVLRDAPTAGFRMRGGTGTLLQVWSRPSAFDTYRSTLRIVLSGTRPVAQVVNEVSLETYLRGVVPVEMPSTWPVEALKAQSIAARSYAARKLRPGVSYFDVGDTTADQVYRGREGETTNTDALIRATAGLVVKSGASIANTMFHSAGGGATEHNENVYVSSTGAKVAGPVAYLRGSRDRRPDGTAYDSASPYATWKTLTYTRSQLSSWMAADPRTNVGTLTAIDLRKRGVSGRLISVTLIGSLGKKTVSGDVFRAVFNARRPAGDPMLRSTLFDTRAVP